SFASPQRVGAAFARRAGTASVRGKGPGTPPRRSRRAGSRRPFPCGHRGMPTIRRPIFVALDGAPHPPHGRSAVSETSDRVVWGAVALAGAAVIALAIAHHRGGHGEAPRSGPVAPSLA